MALSVLSILLIVLPCVRTNIFGNVSLMEQLKELQVSEVFKTLHLLSWKEIVIIHDKYSEEKASDLVFELERDGDILFTVSSLSRVEENDFLDVIYRKHSHKLINIVLLLSIKECSSSSSLVPLGTPDSFFNVKSNWLIFTSCWCRSFTTSRFNTNLTNVAVVIPSCHQYRKFLTLNHDILQTVRGTPTAQNIFQNIRFKLNGKKIIIGAVPESSFKFNLFKLLDVMSRYLNFTYDIVASDVYGLARNGKWSGLIGQIVDKEIDLALATLSNTADRREVVDFAHPLGSLKIGILYKKELLEGDTWFLFTRPLRLEVYLCTALSFFAVSVFFTYLSSKEANERNYNRIANIVEFVFAALLLEGSRFNLKGISARILFVSWLMFCIVMAATYTATLLGSLIPKNMKLFETPQQLLDLPDWQIGILGDTSDIILFNTSKNIDIKSFWKALNRRALKDANILSSDRKIHKKKILQGKYAFIGSDGDRLRRSIGDCSLEYDENFFDIPSTDFSVAFKKGSPLKTEIDLFIDRIEETGLLEEIMKPQDNRLSQCSIIDDTVKPLILDNVKGVFALLAGGVVLASTTLMIENILYSKRRGVCLFHG